MLSAFPLPDNAKLLGSGDSTLDANFSHQLASALFEKVRRDKNPVTAPAARGAGRFIGGAPRSFAFINRGVSGRTIAQIVAALAADIATYQPTHHLFAGGINDVHTGVPLGTSRTQFGLYLDATAGTGKPTLVFLPLFWVGLSAQVAAFNAALAADAAAHAGQANILVIDQYTLLNAASNAVLYTSPDTDQAHHNPAARAAICTAVRPLISA